MSSLRSDHRPELEQVGAMLQLRWRDRVLGDRSRERDYVFPVYARSSVYLKTSPKYTDDAWSVLLPMENEALLMFTWWPEVFSDVANLSLWEVLDPTIDPLDGEPMNMRTLDIDYKNLVIYQPHPDCTGFDCEGCAGNHPEHWSVEIECARDLERYYQKVRELPFRRS